jgi:cytochrome c oxidase subunit 4
MTTPGFHAEPSHASTRTYVGVLVALLVLTGATAGVSYLHLKHGSLPVAMLIAVTKASLVLGWFMHLKWDSRVLRAVLSLALFLVALFLGLTALDWGPRDGGIERAHAASSSRLAARGVR